MRTTLITFLNTLRVTFRARTKILVYFVLPALGVVLSLFINFGAGGRAAKVGVVDHDGTGISVGLVREVELSGHYTVSRVDEDSLRTLVATGKLDCGLIIPAGYGAGIRTGAAREARILSLKGAVVTAWLEQLVSHNAGRTAEISSAAGGDDLRFAVLTAEVARTETPIRAEIVSDRSRGREIAVSSVGFLIYFLLLGSSITMQLVLADRQKRLYSRIRTAPVSAVEYLAGNGLASLFIVVTQVVLVMLLLRFAFRIDTGIPDAIMFVDMLAFGVVSVAFGLVVVAYSRSTLMASVLSNLLLTPTSMIAGCFWPASIMPRFLQRLAYFFPQRWALSVLEGVQRGAGPGELITGFLVLLGFALALFLLASWRFSRLEESGSFV
jgi:ABC-2 type transport system permease protein